MIAIIQADEFAKRVERLKDTAAFTYILVQIRCLSLTLLMGGDKSSQQRNIEKAKKLNQEYE